jgi:hypothetical protein
MCSAPSPHIPKQHSLQSLPPHQIPPPFCEYWDGYFIRLCPEWQLHSWIMHRKGSYTEVAWSMEVAHWLGSEHTCPGTSFHLFHLVGSPCEWFHSAFYPQGVPTCMREYF